VIISDQHRFVFVHIQKTGGTTIDRLVLAQLDPVQVRRSPSRHLPLRAIHRQFPDVRDYWAFGFVRNPWDRMVSWWSMIDEWRRDVAEKGHSPRAANAMWAEVAQYRDFEEFVFRGPDASPRLSRPQIDYLQVKGRRADFIGRTENLGADAATALERFGLSAEGIGHHNPSPRTSYRDYYSTATRDRVAEVFAKDLDAFGYTF
jgi:hypothetical protein